MNLVVFTITLNGLPWLASIYTSLNQLSIPWHWIVVQGAALNTHCSSHCTKLEPQLGSDGTPEFLQELARDSRVEVHGKMLWDGKIEMVNHALAQIKQPCVLMQMDSDEVWPHYAIATAYYQILGCSFAQALKFNCEYMVGPGLRAVSSATVGTDLTEWTRVWTYKPGTRFSSHCPPQLNDNRVVSKMAPWFTHYAYVLESQVRFKEKYYGFPGMLAAWQRLQQCQTFPTPLREYWPYRWVDEGTLVHRI